MKNIHPVRLFVKTILIFVVLNLLFAWWNPPVERLSLYNHLFPGRTRFPYGWGSRTTTISDIDALFASHAVSATKAENEYRVVVLGDSSIWGDGLTSAETAIVHLNEYELSCDGKNVKFYNLGYPHLAAIKDMVFLDRAMDFEPDAIIWSFSLRTILPKGPIKFLKENAAYIYQLNDEYDLPAYPYRELDYKPRTFYQKTIIGRRVDLAWLLKLQLLGGIWAASGLDAATDYRPPDAPPPGIGVDQNDFSADLSYRELDGPTDALMPSIWWGFIDTAQEIAGETPILYVNQPMFIADGENSDLHYNEAYPRWVYDQYHDFLLVDMVAKNRSLLDIWDAIDAGYFTGDTFHLSQEGELIKAELLKEGFQAQICKK
jgi:hypothetical protein